MEDAELDEEKSSSAHGRELLADPGVHDPPSFGARLACTLEATRELVTLHERLRGAHPRLPVPVL